ncbi:tetratricopeptide repeat protein [Desulfolutivibrio sulfoxidireducens]|uniref:tetratricopeptide repeat protein n=1 Tax=Desulfolutivibrio sulfoxidireducens TaxID=2773299 RepID=UPI00159D32F8|nr:tetratricopeptide repeat protein [Desulfolutivibrio sulfoxidireducens]
MLHMGVKAIREAAARALALARRGESARALRCAVEALDGAGSDKVAFGRERIELEFRLREVVEAMAVLPEVAAVAPAGRLAYKKGMERKLAQFFGTIAAKVEAAREAAEHAATLAAQNAAEELFRQARQAVAAGEYPAARRLLNAVCERHPERPGVQYEAGVMLAQAGFPLDALTFFEKAMEVSPRDGRAYIAAADACRDAGEPVRAEKYLKSAIKQIGGTPTAYLAMARMYVAGRKWDKAHDAVQSLVSLEPEHPEAAGLLEEILPRVGMDGGKARRSGKPIVLDFPKF